VKDVGQLGPQIQPVKPHPSKDQHPRIHTSTSAVDTGEAFPYPVILVEEKPRRLEASQQLLVSNAFSSLPPDIGVPPVFRQCHHWKIARCVLPEHHGRACYRGSPRCVSPLHRHMPVVAEEARGVMF
jgi:hypothetical protein